MLMLLLLPPLHHHRHQRIQGKRVCPPSHKTTFQKLASCNPTILYILKLPNNRYNKIASIDFVLCYPANVAANRKYYITREYRRMRKTYPANETVWMPLTVQRRYIILHDGTITSTAFRSEHVEVILSAVRLPVPLVKSLFTELFATLGAKEVLRMPSFLQSGNTFLKITR